MLRELYIKNFGIFAEERIKFDRGMTVVSGETGAGKSLVVGALALVIGARASQEDIRSGCDEAIIEALFEPVSSPVLQQRLMAAGLLAEGEELERVVVRRLLQSGGRSRVYVNDRATTLATLGSLADELIDLSGQHDQQILLDNQQHLAVVDQFARATSGHEAAMDSYHEAFAHLRYLKTQERELLTRQQSAVERSDFLRFRISELERCELKVGEDEELQLRVKRIQHGAKLFEVAAEVSQRFQEADGSTLEQLGNARRQLEKAAVMDESLARWLELIGEAAGLIEEVATEASVYLQELSFDPGERDQLEARLLQLAEVRRKYGSVDSAIEQLEGMRREAAAIENVAGDLTALQKEMKHAAESLLSFGRALDERRRRAAKRFCLAVEKQLHELAMVGANFTAEFVSLDPSATGVLTPASGGKSGFVVAGAKGLSEVIFQFTANPGEMLKALSKVVSGGELSRLLLAIKMVFSGDSATTFIFDEIDSGVGGRQAEVIGEKMKFLANGRNSQVFCVTHLAPIAAFADQHLLVEKQERQGRTEAGVRRIEKKEQLNEVARMLAGARVTTKTLAHAEEMLKNSKVSSTNRGNLFDPPAAI